MARNQQVFRPSSVAGVEARTHLTGRGLCRLRLVLRGRRTRIAAGTTRPAREPGDGRSHREGLQCRSTTKPPAAAISCNSWPPARSMPPARRRLRGRDPVAAARSDDLGAARPRTSDRDPQGGHQRVRFRAGDAQERAAGAFRLHGVGHRRRGDAARQSRGLPEIPAAAAPAGRRQQGRHERRHPGREILRPRSSSRRPAGTRPIIPTARSASPRRRRAAII